MYIPVQMCLLLSSAEAIRQQKDRVYGSMMGAYAVDLIKEGKNHHLVCVKHDELCGVEISEGMKQTKECSAYLAHLGRTLSCI